MEQGTQSGEEQDQMERDHQDTHGQGVVDFEVKEQDRWLPIANGSSMPCLLLIDFRGQTATRLPIMSFLRAMLSAS